MAVQEIKAKLSLDDAEFSSKLSKNEKTLLKFSAAIGAVSGLATAAAVKTAEWQDKIGKLAQGAGTSAESFSKLAVAAQKSNLSQEDLSKTLAKISSRSPEVSTKLAQIGVSYTDASGKAKTSAEVFGDVADKVAKAGTTAQKTAIAVRAFGEEGAKLLPILADGKKGLEEQAKVAEKYGLVVSTQAAAAAAQFNDDMAETQMALKGLVSSLGESIIAWTNQGGIMDKVRNSIAYVTQLWRGLDDTTKNVIITTGAVALAIAGVATALIGLKAIAPSVGAALSKMFGPVGLLIQGVVAAVGAVVVGFAEYGHTLDKITVPASKAFDKSMQNISATMVKFPQTAEEATAGMNSLATSAAKVERPISIIGTAVAWISKQLAIGKVAWGAAFERLALELQVLTGKFAEVKAAASALLSGDLNAHRQAMNRYVLLDEAAALQRQRIAQNAINIIAAINAQSSIRYQDEAKKRVATDKKAAEATVDIYGKAAAQFTNPVVSAYRDIGLAAKKMSGASAAELQKFEDQTQALQVSTTTLATQSAIGYAKLTEAVVGAAGPAINAISMVTDAMAKSTQYAAKVAVRDLEVMGIRAQKAYEDQKAVLEAQNAAEIESINATYDAKIAAVQNGEAAINAAIELARNERLLADDAEYQAAVEKLRLQYEQKLALIDQNSLDLEQRRLNDAVAEASFQRQLADLAAQFAGKKDKTNKDFDAKATAQKKLTDEQVKKLEADKNAALEAEQKRADAASKALDEKKAAEGKALEKQKLQVQYDAELQEFRQTKAVKSVQTVASGIAAAASAFAATAGALPFGLGIPIGLAIAATILGATYASVAQINSQEPVKPAALIAAKGGTLVGGERHGGVNNGVDVKAQRGETILSDVLTNKLDSALSDTGGGIGGGDQIFNFQPGAISVFEITEEIIERLASAVGDRVRRQGLSGA